MTTTVKVQARAWGAKVEVNGDTIELGAHQDHAFQVGEGESLTLTVTHGEAPQDRAAELMNEEVPGSAQNDALLGQGEISTTDEDQQPSTGSRGRSRGPASE